MEGTGDAQLDALVAEGLAGHPSLDAADARLRQAQAQVGTARADELPSLSVSGGYTGLRLPESMVGSEMGGRYGGSSQVAFDFSYGVDLWGGKRAAWEAAVDGAHAATVEAQAARLNLSTGITQAYADLAYAWQLNDVAEEELTRSQKSLELTRQRRSAGIDSDLQVRQAEAVCRPRSSRCRPPSSVSTPPAPRWPRWSARARTVACRSSARGR